MGPLSSVVNGNETRLGEGAAVGVGTASVLRNAGSAGEPAELSLCRRAQVQLTLSKVPLWEIYRSRSWWGTAPSSSTRASSTWRKKPRFRIGLILIKLPLIIRVFKLLIGNLSSVHSAGNWNMAAGSSVRLAGSNVLVLEDMLAVGTGAVISLAAGSSIIVPLAGFKGSKVSGILEGKFAGSKPTEPRGRHGAHIGGAESGHAQVLW